MPHDFVVTVNNLIVKFGDFCAVDSISFSVRRGEIFGFLGANGAGKTTTIRVLSGLLYPTAGTVEVGGILFKNRDDEMRLKRKIGYMSQKFTLYNDLTVEENLSFIACLHKLDTKTYLQRRDEILEFISFSSSLASFVSDLAGGIKQQVSLAAAILHDPEIVFLDEPTAGVTPAMRDRFWHLIKMLADKGKTIFVTTHYMDEAEQCERIALMRTGKIVALGTPADLKQTTFPDKLYEFEPRAVINYSYIRELKKQAGFAYFEPFGLRFHAAFQTTVEAERYKNSWQDHFAVKEITPTLEDVFIKIIERKDL